MARQLAGLFFRMSAPMSRNNGVRWGINGVDGFETRVERCKVGEKRYDIRVGKCHVGTEKHGNEVVRGRCRCLEVPRRGKRVHR